MGADCGSCKHWQRATDGEGWHLSELREGMPEGDDVAEWGTCTLIDLASYGHRTEVRAFTKDGSDYKAVLHTRSDFGCREHEAT